MADRPAETGKEVEAAAAVFKPEPSGRDRDERQGVRGDTAAGHRNVLYDPKTNRIGVKSPVVLDRHFFRVRRTGRGRKTLIINAARLLKQFAIKVDATRVFRNVQCVRFEGQPMLLMSLDEAPTIST